MIYDDGLFLQKSMWSGPVPVCQTFTYQTSQQGNAPILWFTGDSGPNLLNMTREAAAGGRVRLVHTNRNIWGTSRRGAGPVEQQGRGL